MGMMHPVHGHARRVHTLHGNVRAHRVGRQHRGQLTRHSDDAVLWHHHRAVGHGPPREGGKSGPFPSLRVERDAGEERVKDVLT